ncbi:MAG: ABC transporter ATP-binding protein [Candidatus Hydrogenedentes bacterium]|nr:ABC transporter ATP-binding protein [Candidatus Hydrogenedentota bacterium]
MEQDALRIRGLEKSFSKFKLGPIDVTVPRGIIYGLIGPNGAGKTTTIDLVMGMGHKEAGSIEVFGFDLAREEVAAKKRIGYASPDMPFTAWGRVGRVLSFYRSFYPDWDDAYCTDLLRRLNLGWDDKIRTLSFGARTKLGLVLALSHRPGLLLLDEPIIGLDAVSKQEVFSELLDAVRDANRSVVISSHDLHDLERFADHVGIIKAGKMLIEGPTAALVERFRMVDCIAPASAAADITPHGIRGVYVQQQDGRRWRMLVDQSDGAMDLLKARDMTEITAAPVTLEELCVALVKEV